MNPSLPLRKDPSLALPYPPKVGSAYLADKGRDFLLAEQYLLSLSNLPRREYMKNAKLCGVYLERTKFFLKLLGSPEKKIPHYVHITGTSGKGSVATFMASILCAAGKRTALLTSPHASKITERWQVNGKMMTDKEFIDIANKIKPLLNEYARKSPYDMVSFHEITDIIGFYFFAQKKADWAVLEVGCGGRYCSSNVIPHKDAAIITNIGWDHVELLGPSLKKIAYEKAGIITCRCPVFTMEKRKKLRAVFENEAMKYRAVLHYIQPAFTTHGVTRDPQGARPTTAATSSLARCGVARSLVTPLEILQSDITGTAFIYQEKHFCLQTPGLHQVDNAILVINAARALGLPEDAIKKGLSSAQQPLRMEVVSRSPLIILDGAHNVEKMTTTVETVMKIYKFKNLKIGPLNRNVKPPKTNFQFSKFSNFHLIVGFSADKNIDRMIRELATLKPATVVCTRNTINPFRKVANPKTIAGLFQRYCPSAHTEIFIDPHAALGWSMKQLKKDDILLVTGSIFLSGELRPYLTGRQK